MEDVDPHFGPSHNMRLLKSAALYFALVFGAGFVLGAIRVPFLVPRVGDRLAELIEAPLMLGVILLAARWIARRFPGSRRELLATGLGALGFVLAADVVIGVTLRGMSLVEVFLNRDPVSGTVYYALLGLFAVMPWLLSRSS